jgi:hypothetical protein
VYSKAVIAIHKVTKSGVFLLGSAEGFDTFNFGLCGLASAVPPRAQKLRHPRG